MKPRKRGRAAAVLACLLAAAAVDAAARGRDDAPIRAGRVVVAKGETLRGDLVASGPVEVEGTVSGDCVALGGALRVAGRVRGDAVSQGGPVSVSGEVDGTLTSLGGPIDVSGRVAGDVSSMGGNLTLGPKAVVGGEISLLGGRLIKAEGAVVEGDVHQVSWRSPRRFFSRMPNVVVAPEQVGWPRLLSFAALLACAAGVGFMVLAMTVFLPKNVEAAAEAIKADFWRATGIGLLILTLLSPTLLLMIISILGIPLLPLMVLLYCAAALMGFAAFSRLLAERFYEAVNRPAPSLAVGVGVGYVLLTGLLLAGQLIRLAGGVASVLGASFIFAGLMLISCGLLTGLGAMWITRMGSRRTP